ncbi:Pectinesterase [Bertholletia excelsa]
MEYQGYHTLFISFFFLTASNPANAIPFPRLLAALHVPSSPALHVSNSPALSPSLAPSPAPSVSQFLSVSPSPAPSHAHVSSSPAPPTSPPSNSLSSSLNSLLPVLAGTLEEVPLPAHVDPAIQEICASTDYPDLCLEAAAPLAAAGKTDPASLVSIGIKVAIGVTKQALNTADKLAAEGGMSADLAAVYKDCKVAYQDALENFEKAEKALAVPDIGTANTMLSAAITNFGDCNDLLKGNSSELTEINIKLSHITSNCLAVAALLKH